MKEKIYRCFFDVKAENKVHALYKFNNERLGEIRIQEDPFNDEEDGIILELAREALSDADVFDLFANKLDLSDKELKALQKKIEAIMDR